MSVYSGVLLVLTGGMVLLHVLEWRAAASVLPALRTGDHAAGVDRLGKALRLEALYYLAAFPPSYAASGSWVGRLMILFAIYHWAGLLLFESSGFGRQKGKRLSANATGTVVLGAIAVADVAEIAVLAAFAWILV